MYIRDLYAQWTSIKTPWAFDLSWTYEGIHGRSCAVWGGKQNYEDILNSLGDPFPPPATMRNRIASTEDGDRS